jgi:hypothetical protein
MMESSSSTRLHYNTPAAEWSQSLPIGDGRLGAMVYGRTTTQLLQLNENSVWYGGPQDRTPRDDHPAAERLVQHAFFATPHSQRHYEPLGTLTIEFGHEQEGVKDYSRELDLETAITSVQYEYGGVKHSRDVFASYPDGVLVIQLESSEATEFTIRLTRVSEREYETNEFVDSIVAKGGDDGDGSIIMHATPGGANSIHLCSVVNAHCDDDGVIEMIGNCLVIKSRKTTIAISAQTTFRHQEVEAFAVHEAWKALNRDNLRERHIDDYRSLYGRMKLDLKGLESELPTDERLLKAPDANLITLYHNYGRYLLISCSRDGFKALPATLQGLWNPSFQPAWGSKYTININTEMNYWPASLCNLPECEAPLFDLLERMAERGKKTARLMYGCRGWAAHHNTDIWADTDPQDRWMPSTGRIFPRYMLYY